MTHKRKDGRAVYRRGLWLSELNACHRERRHRQFAIGDAMNRACDSWRKDTWGNRSDMWKDASAATGGIPVDSLFQYARVARVFPPPQRKWDLSFGAYHILAGVADEPARTILAERAFERGLTCKELGELVRQLQGKQKTKTKREPIRIRVGVDVYSALHQRAKRRGVTVSALLKSLLRIRKRKCPTNQP